MAVLDPRLLDLIETLTAARMDWLAFELIEAIQYGRVAEESEDTLAATRRAVSGKEQPKARGEPNPLTKPSEPIAGDDQIAWAASYVADRLDMTLAQLDQAIETLDAIVGSGDVKVGAQQTAIDSGPVLVLADGEVARVAGRDDVREARAIVPKLRRGLEAWSARMRGGVPT